MPNHRFFDPCDLEIWWMSSENNRSHLPYHFKLSASFSNHLWIQTGVIVMKRSIRVKIVDLSGPCDLEIWQITSKNKRAPLLCHFKRCALFRSHLWIQTGVTVRKRSIGIKIVDFSAPVTLKFDSRRWETIGHLSCASLNCVHHFVAICEFQMELQARNTQFGSKT